MKKAKKLFSIITCAVMTAITLLSGMSMSASAASTLTNAQITAKLTQLQKEYPQGTKWKTSDATSRKLYGGTGCYGNARELAVKVFGSYPAINVAYASEGQMSNGWKAIRNAKNVVLEPGDIIRADYNAHSAVIWKIENNKVYVAQCFGSSNNKLDWGAFWGNHKLTTVSELLGNGFPGVWKHPGASNTAYDPSNLRQKEVDRVAAAAYFPKYTGSSGSIVTALNAVGATSTYSYRQSIAAANGITGYSGTAAQNTKLLKLLKSGQLKRPGATTCTTKVNSTPKVTYFKRCSFGQTSIVTALRSIGEDSSFNYRARISAANGVPNYTGSFAQNIAMLLKLKTGTLKKP